MAKNVPNLQKETDIQAQQVPNKVNLNRPTQMRPTSPEKRCRPEGMARYTQSPEREESTT